MAILSARKLSFYYKDKRPILVDLNFQAESGCILGLAGANGSGKSTLINILAGIFSPTSGEIRLDDLSGSQTLNRLKLNSALLPQNIDHWLLGETGQEDLSLGLDLKNPEARLFLDQLIERWEMEGFLHRPVETISLGQKKRLAMVAALSHQPEIILLDEPFSGLDWPGIKVMLSDLTLLKKAGVITILTTHEPQLVKKLADAWLLLKKGGDYLFGRNLSEHFEEFEIRPSI